MSEVDWSALDHAYGPATDVPGLLRQLREETWRSATDTLVTTILHQDTLYPATPAALPRLVDVARDRTAPGRLGALELVTDYGRALTDREEWERQSSWPSDDFVDRARDQLERAARDLLPLMADADPEVRAHVYRNARYWRDSETLTGALRARVAVEDEVTARTALIELLAERRLLTSAVLETLAAEGQDPVLFAAAWSALAHRLDLAGAAEHLVRLWPTQAPSYPGRGARRSLSLLVAEAGPTAVPVLRELGNDCGGDTLTAADLAEAWCGVARVSRAALAPAAEAVTGLIGAGPPAADIASETARSMLVLLSLRPASRPGAYADLVVALLDRVPDDPRVRAVAAAVLFGLEDPRWAGPALSVVGAPELPAIRTDRSRTPFVPAVTGPSYALRPLRWASADLVTVAARTIAAHPGTVTAWAVALRHVDPSSAVVDALLPSLGIPEVSRTLAGIDPDHFTPAARAAVLAHPADDIWLLTTRGRLGAEADLTEVWSRATDEERADLVRLWTRHPSPGLAAVCRDAMTGTASGSLPGRRFQTAAALCLMNLGEEPARAVWPTVRAVLDQAGETMTPALAAAQRAVTLDPALRADYVDLLRDIVENGRRIWSGPDHEARASALDRLTDLGGITGPEAVEHALAILTLDLRNWAGTVPPVASVLRREPGRRARAVEVLEPLLAADGRIPATSVGGLGADDIADDVRLTGLLRDALGTPPDG